MVLHLLTANLYHNAQYSSALPCSSLAVAAISGISDEKPSQPAFSQPRFWNPRRSA